MNNQKIIKDQFIDLKAENLPISYYIIRKSLLSAVSELKPIIKGKVLDLACGLMPYKEYLMNDSVEEYIGVDLEPTEYHNLEKPDFYWDGQKIPFEAETFDFVIATEFLEHYFDTSSILKEIQRVLKPGGTFFFTVPNVWPLHEVPYDYHRFTPYALSEHFKIANFSKSDIKFLGGRNYHLALSLAIWYDNYWSESRKKVIKPFFNYIVNTLVKKDKKQNFANNQMFSGLYGFATK